jgi:hypothetical protein
MPHKENPEMTVAIEALWPSALSAPSAFSQRFLPFFSASLRLCGEKVLRTMP